MVDPLGLGLLILAILLIVVELAAPGYYVGVAATIGLVMGLFQIWRPGFLASPQSAWIAALAAAVAGFLAFQFYRRFAPPVTDPSAIPTDLVGRVATVRHPIVPGTGKGLVELDGRRYAADATEAFAADAHVMVTGINGSRLIVARPTALA